MTVARLNAGSIKNVDELRFSWEEPEKAEIIDKGLFNNLTLDGF